ncbi:MAG: hypothetical protein JST59_00365 [Actinobacteria bacterium]|nr:hypothetical protein [Actinomycetota bacterium]
MSKEEEKYVNFIEGVLTVHNKSLLDCFTEEMELIRVYGVRGKPYPWERSFTRTTERVTEDNLKLKLVQTKERVKEISSYHLGNLDRRMPNREFID